MTGSVAAERIGSPRSGTARNRGINYYGNLGRMLRDLTGFGTLTFELLQNADDADATRLRIDVGEEELVVFNDAEFSDCGDQGLGAEDCLYLAERGHRCDFHSFRDVASGDKRDRADTTGAFGIGFTAVYQVADRAVLISNKRRWDIDEIQPEACRIMENPVPDTEGTTLTLPWARDPNSLFRRRTASAAIGPEDPKRLFDVLVKTLPTAMLFLRHVREVELAQDGQTACCYRREDADDLCEITGGDAPRQWLMLHGDFAEEAAALRRRFPGKIEDRRRADVTVAIPSGADVDGLLCAYLPTDERSGLPAHVNADFYPESDRKHLITDSFHGDWNRLAVRAAARVIAERLPELAQRVGYEQLWHLIFAAHESKPTGPNTGITAYWEEIEPLLPTAPVMWTTAGYWTTPATTVILRSSEENDVIPVLEQLGVSVMHPKVRAVAQRMSGLAGARLLTIEILVTALLDAGLAGPTLPGDAPAAIATEESRQILWQELERLLNGRTSPQELKLLRGTALMPGLDGRLWPADQLKRADSLTADLFTDLGLGLEFLDRAALPDGCDQLAALCPSLDLALVLTRLISNEGTGRLQEALDNGRVTAAQILSWLRRDEQTILASSDLASRVRSLPIYPTGSAHRPLDAVVLPGGFTDRLGIAEAIDSKQVSEHVVFLERLGAKRLTLPAYLTEFVPQAASRPGMLTDPRWQELITDLASHLGEFADDAEVSQALTPLPLVACGSALFLPASSCYFASQTVTAVLGVKAPIACPPAGHELSTTSLYQWLGVATEPRLPDVVERVMRLAAGDQGPQARASVAAIIGYLGRSLLDRQTKPSPILAPLRDLAWLPARDDSEWRRPDEVHTGFREWLFATQGRFLEIPMTVQRSAADFLHWLGVETNPSPRQVVDHLLALADQRAPVNREIYSELNHHATDPAINRLIDTACLFLSNGEYVAPTHVFRQTNPFGRFRQLLGAEFDAIGELLDALGVKRIADQEDARDVLTDIAREQQQRFHMPVEDDDDLAVIWHCWRMLDEALAREEVDTAWFEPLRGRSVVPNAVAVLTPPTRLLIDDMPGVAEAVNLGDAIIRRKEGMWRAFQAAGVRSLTEAVDIEILEIRETTREGHVRARLDSRLPALARVLDRETNGITRLTTVLGQLSFPQTPVLQVRYHLPDFHVTSADTSLKALYVPADPHENREALLISCPNDDGTWPWMLIAKELARALYPGAAPGPLASSLFVVLDAGSLDAAHSALDDAGWPRLDHIEIVPPDSGPRAGFGDDSSTDRPDQGQPDHTGDDRDNPAAAAWPGFAMSPATNVPPADAAAERTIRDDSAAPSHPNTERDSADGKPGERSGQLPNDGALSVPPPRPQVQRSNRRTRHGRLRTYVMIDDSEGNDQTRADVSPVDQAGIRQAVEIERVEGRHPQVMPHNNPGFDIVSRDDAGQILRHIEVKSTTGAWDDMGVGLTRTQFNFALEHRETFWLYVVEHALDNDRAHIVRIADPAGRVEEFRFDSGWSAVSEDANNDPPPPTGARRTVISPGKDWIPLRSLRDDLSVVAQYNEWIKWRGANPSLGSYAVQVLGHALEPEIACGDLVLVEPNTEPPAEGELVVVQLRSGFDPDGRASATVRRWSARAGNETPHTGSVALRAAEGSPVPPLHIELSMIDVCGRVVAKSSD
jgi:hypothetical protein